jgi:hypothetical protein
VVGDRWWVVAWQHGEVVGVSARPRAVCGWGPRGGRGAASAMGSMRAGPKRRLARMEDSGQKRQLRDRGTLFHSLKVAQTGPNMG